jgi:pilus assembly protein CpaB
LDPIRKKALIAMAAALLAAGLSWYFLDARERDLLRRSKPRKIITAAHYLPAYTRLEPKDLQWREVPEEYLPKGALESAEEALGLVTLAPHASGEWVLFNKLARGSQSLAAAIPEGQRAFTLGIDPISGVSGLLRPGDIVDVLLLNEEGSGGRSMAATLLQAVRVLAVGTQFAVDEKSGADSAATATLALSPEECELLLFAASRGRLHLTLRSPADRSALSLKCADYQTVLGRISLGERPTGNGVEIIRGSTR